VFHGPESLIDRVGEAVTAGETASFNYAYPIHLQMIEATSDSWTHPFSERRSWHFWAHENMAVSTNCPESLYRMLHPLKAWDGMRIDYLITEFPFGA